MSNEPWKLQPIYTMSKPNEMITLRHGQIGISDKDVMITGDAEVYLEFLPKPRLLINATLPTPHIRIGNKYQLSFPAWDCLGEVVPTRIQLASESPGSSRVTFFLSKETISLIASGTVKLKEVIFHLLNFHNFFANSISVKSGPNQGIQLDEVTLEANDWLITLASQSSTKDTADSLARIGGYAITHAESIKHTSGREFTVDEADNVLDALYYFLSFARGFSAPPILPVGFNKDKEQVWKQWGVGLSYPWLVVQSWFDSNHGNCLAEVFTGFWERWQDTNIWREAVKRAIYWYLISNTGAANIDGSIILTQAALEHLAWIYLVEDKGSLSRTMYSNSSASEHLRLLLSSLSIPPGIPTSLVELGRFAAGNNWVDGAQAFTKLRNNIVHPKNEIGSLPLEVMYEGWNLGQQYIELLLLRLCGYSGRYRNRLTPGWRGVVEPVPWAS